MKNKDFKNRKRFDNMFKMMDFCQQRGLSNENSLLIISEDGASATLYYNKVA